MSGQKIGRLVDHLGYWHDRFARLVHSHVERSLVEHGDVSVSQWRVLVLLFHREVETIPEIAAAFPVDQAEASRLVARVEFKGLVARKVDRKDPSRTTFKLTRKGRQLTLELATVAEASDRECFGALDDDEVRQYKSLLAKLLEAHGEDAERERIAASLRV